jgi:hypothetical protein
MATEAEIRKVIGYVEEYAREDEVDEVDVPVDDLGLEIRRLDLEERRLEVGLEEKKLEMGMKERLTERLLGMFSDGKLTYDQMREMMG